MEEPAAFCARSSPLLLVLFIVIASAGEAKAAAEEGIGAADASSTYQDLRGGACNTCTRLTAVLHILAADKEQLHPLPSGSYLRNSVGRVQNFRPARARVLP